MIELDELDALTLITLLILKEKSGLEDFILSYGCCAMFGVFMIFL